MSFATLAALVAHCHALSRRRTPTTDAELLRRFARRRDSAALEELVQRYAALVWGVCRRILPGEADREDAFQATFLALARQAGTIDPEPALGAWLHTVAARVARKARVRSLRKQTRPLPPTWPAAGNVAEEVAGREWFRAVDEEIDRLPSNLRLPIVLCCLEGRTRDEAAEALGCSVAAVKGRLERGRGLLKRRLERRGIELPAAFLVLSLTGERVRAALWARTIQSALHTSPPAIAALAEAGLRAFTASKLKLILGALAILLIGSAGFWSQVQTLDPTPPQPPSEAASGPLKPEAPPAGMDRQGDPLPPGAIARLGTIRFRHGAMVLSVAFSPDGKMVAAGGAGRTISLWDTATGKELRRFPPFDRGQPARVAFSPDGKMLASVSQANSLVCLYDVNTGKELRLLQRHQSGVTCLAFSPDGKFLASGDNKGTIHVWDPAVKHLLPKAPGDPEDELRHLSGDWGEVHALAFSPDSKLLAFAGEDGKVRLWNARTGDEMRRLDGHPPAIYSLSFSPDGKLLASAGADKTIRLWAMPTGEPIRSLGEKLDLVLAVTFSPDGRLLASAHRDGTLALWDPHTGRAVRRWKGHASAIASVAFSPDGKRLASGGFLGSAVRLWDVATGAELQAPDAHRAAVDLVRWMPDGKTLVSIDREQRILWWDPATQRPRRQVVRPDLPGNAFALSADGKLLATASLSDQLTTIRLGEIDSDKPGRVLGKHQNAIHVMAFSPDGRLLASGSRDEAIRLWDMEAGKQVRQFEGRGQIAGGLAFSPDGKALAYGTAKLGGAAGEKTIRLVDGTTGQEIRAFDSQGWVRVLVFSPDSKVLASWHNGLPPDKPFVRLWDVTTGKELCRHNGHPGGNGTIAFSPDGKLVASGEDGWDSGHTARAATAIHLWEAATGRLIRRFEGHHSGVRSLAFSPDGRTLASGGGDSTILLWDIIGRPRKTTPTPREWDAHWAALADADAIRAYEAISSFIAAPEQAVPFLRRHLRPIPRADATVVARLLADLDRDDFTVRQRATEELSKLGDAVTADLRRALAKRPPLETRRRIQQLLDRVRDWTAESLRDHRAIQALEHIGTSAAKEVLDGLAKGAPAARRTEEAKGALWRMNR